MKVEIEWVRARRSAASEEPTASLRLRRPQAGVRHGGLRRRHLCGRYRPLPFHLARSQAQQLGLDVVVGSEQDGLVLLAGAS